MQHANLHLSRSSENEAENVSSNDGDATTFEAPIVAVEVFRHGALISRRATIPNSQTVLAIHGLPTGLLDSSVRVAPQSGSGLEVVDLHVGLHIQSPPAEADLPEARDVKELQQQLHQLEEERARATHLANELMRLRPVLPPPPKRSDQARFASSNPTSAWLSLAEFAKESVDTQQKQVRELNDQIEAMEDQLVAAQDRLSTVSSQEKRVLEISKTLKINLAAPAPGETIELSYQIIGARWIPTYELRVEQDGSSAELTMNALVAQATGENWNDVQLSLSTADLERTCEFPELGTWRIGRAPTGEQRPGWRPLPSDLPSLFNDFDGAMPKLPAPSAPPAMDLPGHKPAQPPSDGSATAVVERSKYYLEDEDSFDDVDVYEEDAVTPTSGILASNSMAVAAGAIFESEDEEQPMVEMAATPAPSPAFVQSAPGGGMVPRPMAQSKSAARRERRSAPKKKAKSKSVPTQRVSPTTDLLAYGNLVVGHAADSDRGTLRSRSQKEQLPAQWRENPEAITSIAVDEFARTKEVSALDRLALPAGAYAVADSAGHFAHRYPTEVASVLPADGKPHRVTVFRCQLPLDLVHRVVPRVDETVYRWATLENSLLQPLLRGPMDVFWGADFLVTSRLDTTAAGATIYASLGAEPRINIARNVRYSEREEGLLSGHTIHEEDIRIDVESRMPNAVKMEIIERVPVTDDKKLEIEILANEPASEDYSQIDRQRPLRGGRRWRLKVAPAEKAKLRLHYAMDLSSKSEIVGGGRRA
jgi:hypothetical protein